MISEKKILRNKIRELLKQIKNDKNIHLTQRIINDIFLSSKIYKEAQTILAYAGTEQEVSVDLIINTALKDGKKVALPKTDIETEEMNFYYLDNEKKLEEQICIGNYSIREPIESLPIVPMYPFPIKTVIIVPGLAFSLAGDRLGHGKGFYDKYLSKIFDSNSTHHCPIALAGFGFDFQIQETIPVNEKDVKLTHIITNNGLHICNN